MSERESMRKVREVLRLKHVLKLTERQIERSVEISHGTVGAYLKRAEEAGLGWEEAEKLSDGEVEARLFQQVGRNEPALRAPIDFAWVHLELRRAGVTLELLWAEYQQAVADGGAGRKPYQYSQFCELYRAYTKKLSPVMRQTHRAGEKVFIDFSGKRPRIVDATTGEVTEVELFVMVLGASNYTYVEATRTQSLEDFVGATVRGLGYFGAVPELLVPDQLRSAVSQPHRYEPEINATYAELSQHYGTAVVPARPRKPKDKAKVEGGVLLAQRWILACLRNRQFFSLEELNAAIRELLERLNTRPFQKLEGCRRSAFETLDRPAMKPLPSRRYELGEWKLKVGVNLDHHLAYDHRYYSVPSELIGAKVDVRATATLVEVWHEGVRITSHERSYGPRGTAVTKPEHRPRAHREWGEWPPERLVGWAQTKGPKTGEVAAAILGRGPHPESGRRACLGLVRLGERHGHERLEAACARALGIHNPTYKSVEAILKNGLDKVAMTEEEEEPKRVVHENIRGGDYFDRGESESRSRSSDDEDARYLAEERFSIMNESAPEAAQEAPGRAVAGSGASSLEAAGVPPAPRTLPALLERLQGLWMQPRRSPHGATEREGEGSGSRHEEPPSCMSLSVCFATAPKDDQEQTHVEEETQRESMRDEVTCEVDACGLISSGAHRGEVE
jgi:transposase